MLVSLYRTRRARIAPKAVNVETPNSPYADKYTVVVADSDNLTVGGITVCLRRFGTTLAKSKSALVLKSEFGIDADVVSVQPTKILIVLVAPLRKVVLA